MYRILRKMTRTEYVKDDVVDHPEMWKLTQNKVKQE